MNFSGTKLQPARRSQGLAVFSGPLDAKGYANGWISDEKITDIYLEFFGRSRKAESDAYLRTLTGEPFMRRLLGAYGICADLSCKANQSPLTIRSSSRARPPLFPTMMAVLRNISKCGRAVFLQPSTRRTKLSFTCVLISQSLFWLVGGLDFCCQLASIIATA